MIDVGLYLCDKKSKKEILNEWRSTCKSGVRDTNKSYHNLRDHFRDPQDYDKLINIGDMKDYLDSSLTKDIDKNIKSSLLHFLKKEGYLNVEFDKDLYPIGKALYGISESVMQKPLGRNMNIFYNIIEEKNLYSKR